MTKFIFLFLIIQNLVFAAPNKFTDEIVKTYSSDFYSSNEAYNVKTIDEYQTNLLQKKIKKKLNI